MDTIYLNGAHWHVFTTILCEKCADLVVFIGTCVIRSDPFETRSDHFRQVISALGVFQSLLKHLCSYLPVIFRSDFARICDFYIGNAVQFSIRSDPFFEVFIKDLSIKADMYAYWAITYAYTVVLVSILCQNLAFLSRHAIRFLPVLSRSIRNKTRPYALLCKIVPCMPM